MQFGVQWMIYIQLDGIQAITEQSLVNIWLQWEALYSFLTRSAAEHNDHLGQVVSGVSQEEKNVDLRIDKARTNLFGLLGAGFAFKCLLSPLVKFHLYRKYTCPIL